ncbi:MAG: YihY/virulence factor BrkB family protein [Acidobacteriota bacterium]|nr:YihY/virulence factor BrkB family protein [Acidobacteriota bacterium]
MVRACAPTVRYWRRTEVHVFAFSVAANVLLSFYPFLIVMLSVCLYVLKWKAAADAVYFALNDYFPDQLGNFLQRNLQVTVASRGPFQIVSVALLLFTANGIFQPIEIALNRIWRCPSDRSYFKNQLVSLFLIFLCGGLAMISIVFTALNTQFLSAPGFTAMLARILGTAFLKAAAVPISMLILFVIYWLLPNCKIRAREIVRAAVVVGLLLEALKYVNLLVWPLLRSKLLAEYGPFLYSVTIVLWAFLASMLILAGAEWSYRRSGTAMLENEPPN